MDPIDQQDEQVPEEDCIDRAILSWVNELVGDEADDDAFDEATDIVMDVVEQMVDDGKIPEMPDNEADESTKQQWLDSNVDAIKAGLHDALHDGFGKI